MMMEACEQREFNTRSSASWGGGYDSTSIFFVCVQGNSLNVDFLRKNIVARISTNSFMGKSKGNGKQDNS